MKTGRIVAVLIVLMYVLFWGTGVSSAEEMGTGFTYQGRLIDNNEPAAGTYDLQAKLYDSKTDGTQIGLTLTFEDGQTEDGYFSIALDFGSEVFNGDSRYLELAFRSAELTDPCDFVVLEPRTEITPTPYALYSVNGSGLWAASGDDIYNTNSGDVYVEQGRVGVGTTNPSSGLHVKGTGWPNSFLYLQSDPNQDTGLRLYEGSDVKWHIYNNSSAGGLQIGNSNLSHTVFFADEDTGSVGIGCTDPNGSLWPDSTTLEIAGNAPSIVLDDDFGTYNDDFEISNGGDKVLFRDATSGNDLMTFGLTGNIEGNVGIGTASPAYDLDVDGDIRAIGSVYYGGTVGNADGTAYTKPDYVFEQGYDLMTTEQVEQYLTRENHLPWMTSAKAEQQENANVIDMTRMAFETLETAENLQVQIIEQSKLIKEQQKTITVLQGRLEILEKMMTQIVIAKEVQ